LRHAKSDWPTGPAERETADFDRVLAPRGVRAAAAIGRHLHEHGPRFDRVLVSAAKRATETWQLVSAEMPHAPEAVYEAGLYLAGWRTLRTRLQHLPESDRAVLLVAHNPDLQSLGEQLAGGDRSPLADRLAAGFPTGALAIFAVESSWATLSAARLLSFVVPRELDPS
jgi:phosphohistidine phosphatase